MKQVYKCVYVQVNRPITMKKEGIQTRNRKMTGKARRTVTTSSLSRIPSRRLFNLRPTTDFYDMPSYYHNHTPANTVFSVQPPLAVPEAGFYPTHATGPRGYSEYSEGYQMAAGLCGDASMGYAAAPGRPSTTHEYLSAVASSQQYLTAAAAGFHRHLHDLL